MIFEIRRKLFHVLSLIYVTGLYVLPRPTFLLALGVLTGVELALEILRLKVNSVQQFLSRLGGGLFREKENSHLSGVFWMLLGVLLTAFLIKSTPVVATCYFYLIVGDAAASLAGIGIGGPRWRGSKKTVTGSLACFVVCLAAGIALLRPGYSWSGIIGGALAATILEFGIVPLNDNFTIPVGSSTVFFLIYGAGI